MTKEKISSIAVSIFTLILFTSSQACSATPLEAAEGDNATSVTSGSSAESVQKQIQQAIGNTRKLRFRLSTKINHAEQMQTAFDSSIILLGVGTVAAAFFKSSAPAIGGVAIAASGVSAFRDYYNPQKQAGNYIIALKAARCVSTTAEPLANLSPLPYWTAMATLRQGISNVQTSASRLSGVTPSEASGKAAAEKAIASAESAFAGLLAESIAYNSAPSAIDRAHDMIRDFIDLSNHRTGANYTDVQTALNAGIANAAASAAQTQTARSQLMDAIKAQATATADAKIAAAAAQPPAAPAVVKPLSVAAPLNLADASSTKPIAQDAVAPPHDVNEVIQENTQTVAALNAATENALKGTPSPQFTMINTQIIACSPSS